MSTVKIFIFFLILIYTFTSCNFKSPHSTEYAFEANENSADTFVRDVPVFFQTNKWKPRFMKLQELLKIPPIDNGFTSWQIRFWVCHGYTENDTSQLIMIKKEANLITGVLQTYISPSSSTLDTLRLVSFKTRKIKPQSGWKKFINDIISLDVKILPDHSKINGYYLGADSYGVIVEIATESMYRIYEYPDYENHFDKIKEADKILKIMQLIEREFDFKVIY